jgi:hypothetical protein
MQVTGAIAYPDSSPVQVFTMLVDPEFQRLKCAATGASSYDVDITTVGSATVIRCRRTLPTSDLPDFVRPFAAGGLELIETVSWGPAAPDGARTGDVALAFSSQPLSMTGRLELASTDNGTRALLTADLVAKVPLLGGRIERACEPLVQKALKAEETLGITWLAERR